MKHLNKLPFQTLGLESRLRKQPELKDMNLVSTSDLKNESFSILSKELEAYCILNCSRHNDCRLDYTMTRTSTASSPDQKVLTFHVATPDDHPVIVISAACMTSNDFFLLCLSLVGFWTGLSAQDITVLPSLLQRLHGKKLKYDEGIEDTSPVPSEAQKQRKSSFCVKSRQLLTLTLERETKLAVKAISRALRDRRRD